MSEEIIFPFDRLLIDLQAHTLTFLSDTELYDFRGVSKRFHVAYRGQTGLPVDLLQTGSRRSVLALSDRSGFLPINPVRAVKIAAGTKTPFARLRVLSFSKRVLAAYNIPKIRNRRRFLRNLSWPLLFPKLRAVDLTAFSLREEEVCMLRKNDNLEELRVDLWNVDVQEVLDKFESLRVLDLDLDRSRPRGKDGSVPVPLTHPSLRVLLVKERHYGPDSFPTMLSAVAKDGFPNLQAVVLGHLNTQAHSASDVAWCLGGISSAAAGANAFDAVPNHALSFELRRLVESGIRVLFRESYDKATSNAFDMPGDDADEERLRAIIQDPKGQEGDARLYRYPSLTRHHILTEVKVDA